MNKLVMAFCLTILLSVGVFSQTNDDEYKKNEFYVGYSNQQVGNNFRRSLNGFEVSYVRNVSRYFGIKGDFSAAYRNVDFDTPITDPLTGTSSTVRVEIKSSLYNFLGGVQIKDNASKARFKPFAHALVGVAHNRNKSDVTCLSNCTNLAADRSSSDTGFGGAFGGGLDIKINDKIDFRAIQVDYNPVYTNSRVDNNFRFGIGFVFK